MNAAKAARELKWATGPSAWMNPGGAGRCLACRNSTVTDCGVCMAVRSIVHLRGVMKKLALHSAAAARTIIFLDDLFYARKHVSGEGAEAWKKSR